MIKPIVWEKYEKNHGRLFARNAKAYVLGKIRKIHVFQNTIQSISGK